LGYMLKQGTFIRRKYYMLFACSLLGAVANGVNTMLDSVLSGNQLGETALAAVSIGAPLSFILYFFASVYSPGYGILYGRSVGSFDREGAYKVAGEAVVTSIAVGLILALVFLIFKKPFLNYYNCSGELYEYASVYYNWKIFSALLLPITNALYYLLAADADTLLISVGGIGSILANLFFSAVLCRRFGVSGLGMGTVLSLVVAMGVYCLHWLRRTNSIHFRFGFPVKNFLTALKLSSAIAACYLFVAITDMVMNKVILAFCGLSMVAAYSIINLIYSFFESFCAAYNAADGFVSTFLGEKNNAGIKNVMKTAAKATVGLGLFLAVLLLVFAPQLPKLYGMESAEVVNASVKAARWMALAAVPYGLAMVMGCLYPSFGKVGLGFFMMFLNDLFCPLALSVPLTILLGFTGVSVGMGLNAFLVLGTFSLCVIIRFGRKEFPLYLPDYGEETVSFDIRVTNENIVRIRDLVKSELDLKGYGIENIELLLEELFTRISEKNPGKTVLAECTLLFGSDYVRIIVRDDGVIFNFMDENNLTESINAHTLNCLLENVKDKEYILTTSFNRNGVVFQKRA